MEDLKDSDILLRAATARRAEAELWITAMARRHEERRGESDEEIVQTGEAQRVQLRSRETVAEQRAESAQSDAAEDRSRETVAAQRADSAQSDAVAAVPQVDERGRTPLQRRRRVSVEEVGEAGELAPEAVESNAERSRSRRRRRGGKRRKNR